MISLFSLIGEYVAKRRRAAADKKKAYDKFDPYYDYERDSYYYDDRE